jgi:hypothetical protein
MAMTTCRFPVLSYLELCAPNDDDVDWLRELMGMVRCRNMEEMSALFVNVRVADSQQFKSIILNSQSDFKQVLDRHLQKLSTRLLHVWFRLASSLA